MSLLASINTFKCHTYFDFSCMQLPGLTSLRIFWRFVYVCGSVDSDFGLIS